MAVMLRNLECPYVPTTAFVCLFTIFQYGLNVSIFRNLIINEEQMLILYFFII